MKMNSSFLLALVLGLALPAFTPLALAQVEGSPANVDYQGTVFDSSGAPLGRAGVAPNFTSAPTNYTMQFKIWNKQSGSSDETLIWAETQTVTVSLGQFSVRLGSGAPIAGLTTAQTSIADAFANKERYLELSVAIPGQNDGNATPILPRLAFQSSPFSFVAQHAKRADSVGSNNVGEIVGTAIRVVGSTGVGSNGTFSGNGSGLTNLNGSNLTDGSVVTAKLADLSVTTDKLTNLSVTTAKLADSSVTTEKLANGSVNETKLANDSVTTDKLTNLSVTTDKLADNSVTAAKLTSNVGLWTINGQNAFRPSGSVGIGSATPNGLLEIQGGGKFDGTNDKHSLSLAYAAGGYRHFIRTRHRLPIQGGFEGQMQDNAIDFFVNTSTTSEGSTQPGTGNVRVMSISAGSGGLGAVGIGTTSPRAPLDVATSSLVDLPQTAYFTLGSAGILSQNPGPFPVSIYAVGAVVANRFNATSDARIKTIAGPSDAATDLQTLLGVEVTNYTFKDTIVNAKAGQKKVIAQQVEKVFPQAVSKSTDVVPDIYQKAPIQDGWVTLATDLKPGERVRLIGEKSQSIHEVLEIAEGRFRTDFTTDGDQVFVYGREVNDFRTVDYDAIAMLNVSATQQIKKEKDAEVKALREENSKLRGENTELRARVAANEAKDKARDEKIAAIEKLLDPASGTANNTRTVSLRQEAAAR